LPPGTSESTGVMTQAAGGCTSAEPVEDWTEDVIYQRQCDDGTYLRVCSYASWKE
jgi:hypothetical protein